MPRLLGGVSAVSAKAATAEPAQGRRVRRRRTVSGGGAAWPAAVFSAVTFRGMVKMVKRSLGRNVVMGVIRTVNYEFTGQFWLFN